LLIPNPTIPVVSDFITALKNYTDVVLQMCNPIYSGSRGRKITVRNQLRQKCKTLLEKQTLAKKKRTA
jgi:hypothetical protein